MLAISVGEVPFITKYPPKANPILLTATLNDICLSLSSSSFNDDRVVKLPISFPLFVVRLTPAKNNKNISLMFSSKWSSFTQVYVSLRSHCELFQLQQYTPLKNVISWCTKENDSEIRNKWCSSRHIFLHSKRIFILLRIALKGVTTSTGNFLPLWGESNATMNTA